MHICQSNINRLNWIKLNKNTIIRFSYLSSINPICFNLVHFNKLNIACYSHIYIFKSKIILSSWIHFVFKINRFMPILSNLNKLIWNKCQNQINANNKLLSFFCFECRNHICCIYAWLTNMHHNWMDILYAIQIHQSQI